MEAEKHAGQVMLQCLNRISNGIEAGAMNKWLELVEEAHAAEADAEADDLRSQVLRAKQERAARVMQQCLNRICNSKYAFAWSQWRAVIASMLKAAQTMQRCLNMISNLK